jgi:4-amino-4-deoxy-L-arabinose transferase-like glycosyltransferase
MLLFGNPELSPRSHMAAAVAANRYPRLRRLAFLFGLAILFTWLNSLKPLHVDDTYFHYYAAQIARHPLDPYGFQIFWWQRPVPANRVLAPPVFLYWWGLGIRLLGDDPVLWKWWLLPFAMVFVAAVHALLRRFARNLAGPLTALTVLSPVFLPGFNFMVDVPAVALALSAIAIFLRARDRNNLVLAVAGGLVAGAAMLTKYTAFVVPGVFLAHALVFRRWRLGLLAACIASLVFGTWECWVVCRYGESSFLCNLHQQDGRASKYLHLALPLFTLLGGVAPALWLLGLAALRCPRWPIIAAGVFVLVSFGSIVLPAHQGITAHLTLGHVFFWTLGLSLALTTAAVARRLLRSAGGGNPPCRVEWFLLLWLGLEIAGYFVLSPFAAVRRVMGIYTVTTLLIGRLAARNHLGQPLPRFPGVDLIGGIVALGIAAGLFYYGLDLHEATVQRRAVKVIARSIDRHSDGACWYLGHGGFQFYAERAGLKPVVPDRSLLRAGDWLIVPDERCCHQRIVLKDTPVELRQEIVLADRLPVRTLLSYYGGRIPLEHDDGPRVRVGLYRVQRDFVPASAKDAERWSPPGA